MSTSRVRSPRAGTAGSETTPRVERQAVLRWVPLAAMDVNPLAQRDLKEYRIRELLDDFDLEQFGAPTVNHVESRYHIIDGQHRIETLKRWFGEGEWEDQQVQCFCYEGLTSPEEAEVFLRLNNQLTVNGLAKFRLGVEAGRSVENEVDAIVRGEGLRISPNRGDGAISAVGTLMKIYHRAGSETLQRTLRILRDAYGDAGLEAQVIDGIGLLCHRYNGELNDAQLVRRLACALGGVNGLLGKADVLRRQTGNPKGHCVAAAAVDIHNSVRGGKKLPSWWKATP